VLAHPSQIALGRAGFLVLVVSVISPAALPIANQIEQTFFQFLLVSISWAWATLAREFPNFPSLEFRTANSRLR
jgi:hypothetical protein